MRKFFIYFIFSVFVLFSANLSVSCAEVQKMKTIAVMSDVGHRHGSNYLICGAAADIIAADIINRINLSGRMKAPLLGDTMAKITRTSIPLYYVSFFNEYKYNYNVDFVNLKRVTKSLEADYILMVTSGLDVQSGFLKDTWWNKLNVPGMDPVRPTYKLATLITLIDKSNYNIVWQDMYLRDIEAENYDLGIVQFSPSYSQLSKIKKYSKNMSEYVVGIIDKNINPSRNEKKKDKAIEMKGTFVNEGTKLYYPSVNAEIVKENLVDIKNNTQTQINNMQTKWNTYQKDRQQKKYIENVNRIQKKEIESAAKAEKIKAEKEAVEKAKAQKVKAEKTKITPVKKQTDVRLFESIRGDVEGITNSLPAPRHNVEENYVSPVVDVSTENSSGADNTVSAVSDKAEEVMTEMPDYNWNIKRIDDSNIKQ